MGQLQSVLLILRNSTKGIIFIRDVLKLVQGGKEIWKERCRRGGRTGKKGVVDAKWDDDDDDDEEHEGQQKKEKKYANGIVGIVLIAVLLRELFRGFCGFSQIPTNVYSLKVLNI